MPSTSNTGSEWVVGRVVSKHPPWSTETSTMTERGFIWASMSRVTIFGAERPGTSTAPINRSARPRAASRVWRLLARVVTWPWKRSSSRRSCAGLVSRIATRAPMPRAILAEFSPTMPPPMMTTSLGGTPGTPESRVPRPPSGRCR